MARQIAQVPLTGTLGDITFYKTTESGFLARMKTSLDAKRLKNDAAFEGSRNAYAEFGRASEAAGLLRHTMLIAGHDLSDTRIISRLTGKLIGIIGTDSVHIKGERLLGDANLGGMVGFEWNKHQSLGGLCRFAPVYRIDAGKGLMEVELPKLSARSFSAPASATHYELIMEGAGLQFGDGKAQGKAEGVADSSGWSKLSATAASRVLTGTLSAVAGRRMVVGLGVRFGQEVNGVVNALADKTGVAFLVGAVM